MALKAIGNLFGVTAPKSTPEVNNHNFVKDATNKQILGGANLKHPEYRGNGVQGENIYCLA